MSCNSTKCATCDGSCGDKPVARPSSPPMVSLPLSLYNHLVNLKDEVEKLRKQAEDPATEYDVRTMWCEACVGVAKERDELKSRLEFLYQEFGKAEADTLTRDALELKLRITEQERDEARAEVERLRARVRSVDRSTAYEGKAFSDDGESSQEDLAVVAIERDEARAEIERLRALGETVRGA